jgi:hypothetical protein
MARVIREETDRVVTTEPVIEERPVVANNTAVVEPVESRATQIVYLILTIIEALLAIRLILRLLGANPVNAFVNLIYNLTYPLIVPFVGIFALPSLGAASFEIATLIAMGVYAIVAYIIVAIIRISRTRPAA